MVIKSVVKRMLCFFVSLYYRGFFLCKHVSYTNIPCIRGRLFLRNRGKISLGSDITINSKYSANPIGGQSFMSIIVCENAELEIGDWCGISNSAIYCMDNIKIGRQVYIGGDTKIYDTDFHSLVLEKRVGMEDDDIKTKPVVIEDGAFIGTGCIILKGVRIGQGSVIGAGSVLTKNVPAREIWAGNPAKFIKKING